MVNFFNRVIKYLKKNGINSFFTRTVRFFYEKKFIKKYYKELACMDNVLYKQNSEKFSYEPLISIIIPLYNTPKKFFVELVDTILNQSYENWELCLADGTAKESDITSMCMDYAKKDKRIKYKLLKNNGGISENTNEALKMATGDFVFLADHDDLLELDALYEVVKAINSNSEIDSIYSDEDKIAKSSRKKFEPHLKPDYDIEYLRTNNYICHIFVTRTEIALEVGGFCREYDGAQDFDFILKCCEKSRAVYHIPRILYHWRCHINSTAGRPESKMYAYEAGAKAIAAHYERCGMEVTVKNDGMNYGYYVADRQIKDDVLDNYLIIRENDVRKINDIIRNTDNEYLLLLDKEIESNNDYVNKLLQYAQDTDVAAVTCNIITSKNKVIQGPIILGKNELYIYKMYGKRASNPGYFRCMTVAQNVTLADYRCVMIKKSIVTRMGGLNEDLPLGLAIFEYSLYAEKENMRTVYTPYAKVLYNGNMKVPQYDNISLGHFKDSWRERIKQGDLYYNRNFDLCKKAFF